MHHLLPLVIFFFTAAATFLPPSGDVDDIGGDLGDPVQLANPLDPTSNVKSEEILAGSDNPPWRSTRDGRIVDPKKVGPNENLYKQGWNPTKNNPCPNVNTVCCHTTQYFTPLFVKPCWNNYDGALDLDYSVCAKDMIYCCSGFSGNTGINC